MEIAISECKQDSINCHEEIKIQYPLYANEARQLIINYLKKYDPKRLSVYLGYTSEIPTITGLSYERLNLQHAQFLICSLLEDEANGNLALTPLIKDVFIRRYLDLPFKVIKAC
ncbi:MAG: hypothetical protein P1U70_06165 [Saprospiraceae bacterium]|jgi:hypothetical protein|nr:hypothetical protein [Saprospiraceae bacterium]